MLVIYNNNYNSVEAWFRRLFAFLYYGPDYYDPEEPIARDAAGNEWFLM